MKKKLNYFSIFLLASYLIAKETECLVDQDSKIDLDYPIV